MIIAVLSAEDAPEVTGALTRAGYPFTTTAGKGGFYGADKQLMFMAVSDMNISEIISTIKRHCHTREETVPDLYPGGEHSLPNKVSVGGAVVFVTELDRFQRL